MCGWISITFVYPIREESVAEGPVRVVHLNKEKATDECGKNVRTACAERGQQMYVQQCLNPGTVSAIVSLTSRLAIEERWRKLMNEQAQSMGRSRSFGSCRNDQ
jgi:hypothetical protein